MDFDALTSTTTTMVEILNLRWIQSRLSYRNATYYNKKSQTEENASIYSKHSLRQKIVHT